MQSPKPARLLTLGQISRAADVPVIRVSRMIKSGAFVPDFTSGNAFLFHPERLDVLRAHLRGDQTSNFQS